MGRKSKSVIIPLKWKQGRFDSCIAKVRQLRFSIIYPLRMNTQERISKAKESWARYHDVDAVIGDVNELLDDDEFHARHVDSYDMGSGRWYRHMLEVVEIDEGVFVGVAWDSGLTESQENMYEDDDVYPVEQEIVQTIEWKIGKSL